MSREAAAFLDPTCDWEPRGADEVAFRNGLAKLASGVAIVSCWGGGAPRGLLVSSLTGLSTQPPRLLFCVRKAAAAHDHLLKATATSVSILSEGDLAEAERFAEASRALDRFNDGRWKLDPQSPPERLGALATFRGTTRSRIDGGTHSIIILDITHASAGEEDPLLYFERGFRSLR